MKKLKIYLDTSVISHLEANDAPELMKASQILWKEIKSEKYEIIISTIVIAEIAECAEPKRAHLFQFLEGIKYDEIEINEEIEILSSKYISECIIPEKYEDDALHLAAATVENCDIILTWNFKHMIKRKTIIGINSINKISGYRELEILTPDSMLDEED